jgi:NADH-quinone oxidoreductase subunit A
MEMLSTSPQDLSTLWPILVYAAFVILMAAAMIIISHLLGERHQERLTGEPYESGVPVTSSARLRFTSQFYLIAMFFVIFDLDAAFIIAWAISFREVGWAGYIGIAVFIGILLALLIYEWRIGALNYGPVGKDILRNMKKRKE